MTDEIRKGRVLKDTTSVGTENDTSVDEDNAVVARLRADEKTLASRLAQVDVVEAIRRRAKLGYASFNVSQANSDVWTLLDHIDRLEAR